LKTDEPTIRAGEGNRFCPSVDGFPSERALERDSLIPSVPLIVSTKGAVHPTVAAPEEIEDALRRDQPLAEPTERKGAMKTRFTSRLSRRLNNEAR
jgi:hypothetical protein